MEKCENFELSDSKTNAKNKFEFQTQNRITSMFGSRNIAVYIHTNTHFNWKHNVKCRVFSWTDVCFVDSGICLYRVTCLSPSKDFQ